MVLRYRFLLASYGKAFQPFTEYAEEEIVRLITCIECGAAVSTAAEHCVTCGGDPRGVCCPLCSDTLAKSKAIGRIYDYDEGFRPKVGYHPDCLHQFELEYFIRVSARCPDCGKYLDALTKNPELRLFRIEEPGWDWKTDTDVTKPFQWDPGCPSCGRPKVLDFTRQCAKCKLPIYRLLHEYYGRYRLEIVRWSEKMAPIMGYRSKNLFHYPKCSVGFPPPATDEKDYVSVPGEESSPVDATWEQPFTPKSGSGCSPVLVTLVVSGFLLLLAVTK